MKSARLLWVAAAVLAGVVGVVAPGAGSASASTGGPKCGGIVLMKASGLPWVCSFDEEFNGRALNVDRWKVDLTSANGFHPGAACAVDSPRTVSVADGYLKLRVHRTARPFNCATRHRTFRSSWKAGSVHSRKFAQAYGLIAVRAKFPEAHGIAGLQSAIWTYPRAMTLHKAITGTKEIDIAEAYSRWPDLVMPTVHNFLGGNTANCSVPDYGGGFHTYSVLWTPSRATFFYDGVQCFWAGRTGTSQPFLIALTQGLGTKSDLESPRTPSPALMKVDWVRVWK